MTLENLPTGPSSSGPLARTLSGRIKIHPAGYGFVVPDDKSEDVHVSARNRGAAMDADTVEIEAWPGVRGVEGGFKGGERGVAIRAGVDHPTRRQLVADVHHDLEERVARQRPDRADRVDDLIER